MRLKSILLYSHFAVYLVCLFVGREVLAIDFNGAIREPVDRFERAIQGRTMLISLENKKYSGRGSLNVDAEVEALPNSYSLENAKRLEFILSTPFKSSDGIDLYEESFIAEFQLSKKTRDEFLKGKAVNFKVDLSTLGWDEAKSSILVGKPFTTISPGRYLLSMRAWFADSSKAVNNKNGEREFYSNQVELEIINH